MVVCNPDFDDPFRCHTKEEYLEQLLAMLPHGRAWQSHDSSTSAKLARYEFSAEVGDAETGDAEAGQVGVYVERTNMVRYWASFAEVNEYFAQRACALLEEFFCQSIHETFDWWGDDYGFPDPCDPWTQLCEKVAAIGGANCAYIKWAAGTRGWAVECADCNKPPLVKTARAGCALAGCAYPCNSHCPPNAIYVTIHIADSPAYQRGQLIRPLAGAARAGCTYLCTTNLKQVECLIERVKGAHILAIYNYVLPDGTIISTGGEPPKPPPITGGPVYLHAPGITTGSPEIGQPVLVGAYSQLSYTANNGGSYGGTLQIAGRPPYLIEDADVAGAKSWALTLPDAAHVKFELREADHWPDDFSSSVQRSQIDGYSAVGGADIFYNDVPIVWEFDLKIEGTAPSSDDWCILEEWYQFDQYQFNGSAPLELGIAAASRGLGDTLCLTMRQGTSTTNSAQVVWTDSATFTRGTTYRLRYEMMFGPQGYLRFYKNGAKVADYSGQLGFTDCPGCVHIVGPYRPVHANTISMTYGNVKYSVGATPLGAATTISTQAMRCDWDQDKCAYTPAGSPWWALNNDWNSPAAGTQSVVVYPNTFPSNTKLQWNYGKAVAPGDVWGYPALMIGETDPNFKDQSAVEPAWYNTTINALTRFRMDWDIGLLGNLNQFNVLVEGFPNGSNENGLLLNCPGYLAQYLSGLTGHAFNLGGVDGFAYPDAWSSGGKTLLILPTSVKNGVPWLKGSIDWAPIWKWAVTKGYMVGTWQLRGMAFGVEAQQGSGSLTINSLTYDVA